MVALSEVVLDASAVLAVIAGEPGADVVLAAAESSDALVGAVNLAEVATKLIERGVDRALAETQIGRLPFACVAFDQRLAYVAGELRAATRDRGLSLGDRACLALAVERGAKALTADRAWDALDVGVPIDVIR